MKITIGKHQIGNTQSTFIIAEIAGNFDGRLSLACHLIDEAKKAGADAVKFQLYRADSLMIPKPKNLLPTYNYFKRVELPEKWLPKLYKYTTNKGIEFLCTPFYPQAVSLLNKIGIPAFKIASGDLTNTRLLKLTAKTKRPILLSTGMSYLHEIKEAINSIMSEGNKKIILMHCNSTYPTPIEGANLRAIVTLAKKFSYPVGLSDHTPGIGIPVAAVSLGASVIEKHVTCDRSLPGMDHSFALEFDEFKKMVEEIRRVEKGLGDGIKKPLKEELRERKWARRAVHPIVDIKKGTTITQNMIDTLRPNIGIAASDFYKVIGKKAKRNIKTKSNIYWRDLR